jgi:ABC-type sugar transport system permease subunit
MKILRRARLSYERKKGLAGLLFIAPWILGVTWFFIYPMITAVGYIFYNVQIGEGKAEWEYVGLSNIRYVFLEDPDNVRMVVTSFLSTMGEVALILAFSIFIAIILSQRFKGRTAARAVFALPIIVSSGILLSLFRGNLFISSVVSATESTVFQSAALEMSMLKLGLDPSIVGRVKDMVANILDLIWKFGVQTLLFLSGIQSIPRHLYEVCAIEGANSWEAFWKVTFPLLGPFIMLNTVYSIIDAFTFYSNPVMIKVESYFSRLAFSSSTTLTVFYCLYVLLLTGVVVGLLSRRIYYVEK